MSIAVVASPALCVLAPAALAPVFVGAKQVLRTCFAPTKKMVDAPQARFLRSNRDEDGDNQTLTNGENSANGAKTNRQTAAARQI
jgi:hypothetical protein